MTSISQKMNASINFGGNIDSSWGQSTAGLNKGLKTVTQQSGKLTAQQKKLREAILKAKNEGKNINELKLQYDKVGRAIKRANDEQEELNRNLKLAERLERRRERWGKVGQLGGRLGRTVGTGLGVAAIGGLIGAGIGAVMTPVSMNAKTAESVGKARTYGVGVETYNAWDSYAQQMGLNGENFGDLLEELKNKVGEYKATGEQSSLNDAFKMLGFGAGDLAGMNNEQMFEKIIGRALTHKDEQEAASAVDMLMGGEANKILTYMRLTGKSYKEMMDQQKRYNLVTKEGADGAIRGNIAFNNLRTVWGSSVEEIAGKLGNDLAPMVTELADELSDWFKNGGIEVIASTIRESWIPALIEFGNGLITFSKVAMSVARFLSKFVPDENEDKKDVLRSLGRTGSTDIARQTAERSGLGEWFDKQLQANPNLLKEAVKANTDSQGWLFQDNKAFDKGIDDIYSKTADNGAGDPVLSKFSEMIGSISGSGSSEKAPVTDNRRQQVNMTVIAQPGQDPQAVADSAVTSMKNLDVFNGNNAMHDPAEVW
ncbi:Uncharacterised protein [Serratia proteamaculans]|uniref:hypothetical protein n=1 Tax=Serratia proteamaculans TaxID=28151 RepID=UPI0021840F9A|nr:hypothetical protein [Serratia proteamaculans]CAI2534764.1 Uncharacterised protein [Serratia proteamaculans]